MKVSLIQMNSGQDKAKNLRDAESLARQAIDQDGSKLVIFPEHVDWCGGSAKDRVAAGEAVQDGPAYNMCRKLAQDLKVFVHSGSFYETAPGAERVYNTSVVFDPQGQEISRYR